MHLTYNNWWHLFFNRQTFINGAVVILLLRRWSVGVEGSCYNISFTCHFHEVVACITISQMHVHWIGTPSLSPRTLIYIWMESGREWECVWLHTQLYICRPRLFLLRHFIQTKAGDLFGFSCGFGFWVIPNRNQTSHKYTKTTTKDIYNYIKHESIIIQQQQQ